MTSPKEEKTKKIKTIYIYNLFDMYTTQYVDSIFLLLYNTHTQQQTINTVYWPFIENNYAVFQNLSIHHHDI